MLLLATGDHGNFGRFALYALDLMVIFVTTHWQAQVAQNLTQWGSTRCCHYLIFPLLILSVCDHTTSHLGQMVDADIVKGFGQVWSAVMLLVAFLLTAVVIHLIIDLNAQTAWSQCVCTTSSGSGLDQWWPTWFGDIDQVLSWKTWRGLFLSLSQKRSQVRIIKLARRLPFQLSPKVAPAHLGRNLSKLLRRHVIIIRDALQTTILSFLSYLRGSLTPVTTIDLRLLQLEGIAQQIQIIGYAPIFDKFWLSLSIWNFQRRLWLQAILFVLESDSFIEPSEKLLRTSLLQTCIAKIGHHLWFQLLRLLWCWFYKPCRILTIFNRL